MNTFVTLAERISSIVKQVLSQSQEAPSRFNCSRMMPPCFSVHAQACFKNSSRERSLFSMPSLLSLATTLASVAMEAWSVPGTQQAFLPSKRARLTSTSCIVLFSMCPMCRTPVTLGGGITIQYGVLFLSTVEWKNLCSNQY